MVEIGELFHHRVEFAGFKTDAEHPREETRENTGAQKGIGEILPGRHARAAIFDLGGDIGVVQNVLREFERDIQIHAAAQQESHRGGKAFGGHFFVDVAREEKARLKSVETGAAGGTGFQNLEEQINDHNQAKQGPPEVANETPEIHETPGHGGHRLADGTQKVIKHRQHTYDEQQNDGRHHDDQDNWIRHRAADARFELSLSFIMVGHRRQDFIEIARNFTDGDHADQMVWKGTRLGHRVSQRLPILNGLRNL